MPTSPELQALAINTIRFLSVDAIQKANSGHPGLPMGAAAMAYAVWTHHLRHNPLNPRWFDRDRFVLSGGHGSMLLYSMLHLTGYDLSMDQIKSFRQWGSQTPGHPEYGVTPGVETTTGPLGQGFANGVGLAIAEAHLASVFNRPGHEIINHFVYAIVTDGDLMEGVASEAASLAGHLRLGKLIYLYDDNHISLDGPTDWSFTEDRGARFEAYGWHVIKVADGNDVDAIDAAINQAKLDPRPSIILCRTHIGYGLPTRHDTAKAHGEPPGQEELDGAKKALGWPLTPSFFVPDESLQYFRQAQVAGAEAEAEWNRKFADYKGAYPELAVELERRLSGKLPEGWDQDLPVFPTDPKGQGTRAASRSVLNVLSKRLPELIGGSADLSGSNYTWPEGVPAVQAGAYEGRNIHFGVRENAMGSIVNAMTIHAGLIPYGGTFLVFSDYMRPAIRLSALSHFPSIWVFTHDSIGVGEDGPTHQPVEHLASLRAIPNLVVIRPGDANESREAWKVAITHRDRPTVLVFSRQPTPTIDRETFGSESGLEKGAYVLADIGDKFPQVILMASGTEVSLIMDAGIRLAAEGVNVRLVSFPSWELFADQDQAYQDTVLPPTVPLRLSVEAGVAQGWERWVGTQGRIIALSHFGASAPMKTLYQEFGFTVDHVIYEVLAMIGPRQPSEPSI